MIFSACTSSIGKAPLPFFSQLQDKKRQVPIIIRYKKQRLIAPILKFSCNKIRIFHSNMKIYTQQKIKMPTNVYIGIKIAYFKKHIIICISIIYTTKKNKQLSI